MLFQTWEILGQKWIFLAVCDGHSGSHITADHTIAALPPRLQASLQDVLTNRLHEQVERETLLQNASLISSALGREVERFDKGLGRALKKICPHPENLTEAQSEELVRVHDGIIQRAYRGCTLGVALTNVATRCMWTLNVGDTTVGLSSEAANGRRAWVKLSDDHSFRKPQEYFRVMMSHPHEEIENITERNCMLGWLDMTRSIGDYAMKFPRSYIDHVFTYIPEGQKHVDPDRVLTPPYLVATPSVNFTDLNSVWDAKPIVLVFSDGVDTIAEWYGAYDPGLPTRNVNPGRVVSQILGNDLDRADVAQVLGHSVDPSGWTYDGNRAVEVLANLFGGTDGERISEATRRTRAMPISDDDVSTFYIDDTSLIVCALFE
ncbi:hypothetical protein VTO73DRAFT_8224 [Trametes versicolor]